jgi:hypothetical protein
MFRRYFNRIVVWSIMIAAFTGLTIYGRGVFIDSVKDDIIKLKSQEQQLLQTEQNLIININRYNVDYFEVNKLSQLIPTGYSQIDFENYYIKKPVRIDGVNGILNNYTITNNVKPEYLNLSRDLVGTRVSAIIEFQSEQHIYNYIQELYDSAVLIYVQDINFSLPSENTIINDTDFKYILQIQYFVFNY